MLKSIYLFDESYLIMVFMSFLLIIINIELKGNTNFNIWNNSS